MTVYPGEFKKKDDVLKEISSLLKEHYKGVRLYHLCTPVSVLSYYKQGILCPRQDRIKKDLRERLGCRSEIMKSMMLK